MAGRSKGKGKGIRGYNLLLFGRALCRQNHARLKTLPVTAWWRALTRPQSSLTLLLILTREAWSRGTLRMMGRRLVGHATRVPPLVRISYSNSEKTGDKRRAAAAVVLGDVWRLLFLWRISLLPKRDYSELNLFTLKVASPRSRF